MIFQFFLVLLSGCASLSKNTSESESVRELSLPAIIIPKNSQTIMVNYAFQKKTENAETFLCDQESQKTVVLHHDEVGWGANFCQTWIAQLFVQHGFNVIGSNRSGYGKSTGKKDLSGQQSIEAIKSSVKSVLQRLKKPSEIVGSWGFGSGGIAAGRVAKNFLTQKWIILGNTVYDFEQQIKNQQSKIFTPAILELKKTEGDSAVENRSLAFESIGIPKKVFLYHSRLNIEVVIDQMSQFADGLVAQQFQVKTNAVESDQQQLSDIDQYNVVKDFVLDLDK